VEKDLKITAVVRRLNHVIHRSGLTSRFVSLLYGEIESGGNLAYTNAGHEPGLVVRASGEIELMHSTGIVMGPLEEAEYGRKMLQIDPGDAVVLYSDGVIERRDPGGNEEFGLDRFKDVLRDSLTRGFSAAEVCEFLLERLRAFGGLAPLADDVTILVIRRLAT